MENLNNFYSKVLFLTAKKINKPYYLSKSRTSESSYLVVELYDGQDLDDIENCFSVRLSDHPAFTDLSERYFFNFDNVYRSGVMYVYDIYTTGWGFENNIFSERQFYCEENDKHLIEFKTEEELIDYMSSCLVKLYNNCLARF